ncbi:hypothetical protein HPP92_012025 [Vanilla planifolia]|uniref:Receptor ligand binding region domain-containing protein n=1 Tax=Vanilla planifolia TaxID=51239 RepID=A0A835V5K9_VANPL|nr:hypothetical protein HPP92_012025 [Vanilla planifolia]
MEQGLGWNAVADGENLSSTAKFDVGVILDMNTWLGKISWSCMLMAADDFYEVHSNHTTKLSFHLKDSEDDVVNAGLSAYEFITKVRVRAIIGPQTSSESKFVAELGSKFHVPTISFTSTTPFLSSTTRTPYFIPTAISDSVQAKVIAALIQTFKWREAILLMEDSDFGIGIASHLIDSFQDIDASISHKCMISLPSTISQILQKLGPLKNMQVKVFVVHASYDLVS